MPGTVQATQQNGQRYQNETVRLETNGVFKTGSISHDLTMGVSQDWMYQPNFTSYTFTAPQNLYNPVDISALTPSGTQSNSSRSMSATVAPMCSIGST